MFSIFLKISLYTFCVITVWNIVWFSLKTHQYQQNTFAVIIPAHNEGQRISALLESLHRQTLLPKTIIICDDNSTDNTSEIVKHCQQQNVLIDLVCLPRLPPAWTGKP